MAKYFLFLKWADQYKRENLYYLELEELKTYSEKYF